MKIKGLIAILFAMFSVSSLMAQTVTLDYYFNHEVNKTGKRFHYMWEDTEPSGFSIFGQAFKNAGGTLSSLDSAPTAANLKGSSVYIIVDPDTKKESPNPNYITEKDVVAIEKWVKNGGVLLMLANDSANVELPHFNTLAAKFGMHFNDDLQNHVIDDKHFADGAINTAGNPMFPTAKRVFLKDVCSISTSGPAKPALKNAAGATIIATAKVGKGTVIAIGDPWLYNEYTNGRLPAEYENDKAANDIAAWLLKQVPRK